MKLQAVMENLQRQQRARLELEARQQHEMEQREGRSAGGAEPTAGQQLPGARRQQQQQRQHEQRLIAAQQTAALAAMRAAAAAAGAGLTRRGDRELGMEPDGSPRLSESSEALSEEDEAAEEEEEMEGDEEEHFPDPMGSEEDMAAAEEEEQEEEDFEDEMAEEAVSRVKEEPGVQRSDQAPRLPGQRRPLGGLAYPPHPQLPQPQDQTEWTYEEQFKQLYELDSDPRRKEFLDDLFTFMQKRGTPVNRIPIMAKQVLDLYMLYMLVTEKGGLVEVINKKLWREITKGLSLPTSITSAAFTLRTQYMKYLYPYECEKRGLSSPNELQVAIDSNRREGRRHSFGSSLFSYSPSGTPSALSSSKLQVPTLSLASNGSPIGHLTKIKKEDNVSIPLPLGGRLPISLSSQQVAAVQAAAAQAAVAAQAVALDQLREKLESGEPPEKRMAVGSDEQQRLMQRAIQQNLLAMTAQIPMNIRINSQDRQESALNLTTNGMSSISMSVEINGIVYTGVLFGQGPGVSGVSSSKGNGNKTNSSQVPPGLSVPRTPTSSSSHTSNSSSP
ncbi:AT-rich interactive domain-containing protein 3A [Callorhinchus milii]|uniref:AT-rich interactive domain-containing protein 3A n=1 Tax=Callorhinchus milii TaxID=7868 RepID=UPI0004574336|nr:AT-rich interactive domain-containing protein 3A [Callorhinchus milii]|eukprot:gi/632979457/ref/XP_007906480.1/ PREDICTED: AT-rich interactive domain-containing protein 3A [Callorhinchus milii]